MTTQQLRGGQHQQRRWKNAINRAVEIDGEAAARYLGEGRFLIISASDPDAGAYEVNLHGEGPEGAPDATCTCKAAEFGQPCWHRATALLMAGLVDPAPADAPPAKVEPTITALLDGSFRRAMQAGAA